MSKSFFDGRVVLHAGDCLYVLDAMPENSVDSIVTDPPYHLTSIVKRFGAENAAPAKAKQTGAFARASAGFMGQKWDGGDIAFQAELWAKVLRVLKPGGHVVAFSGTRTYHRMACAIEDAGFEIRDQLGWVYGCLDEQTQVATKDGVKHYHKIKVGDPVLCYDIQTGEYGYQPVLEVVEYDYADTAYRIVGDFGEQVVSRNHRCIVERGGVEAFQLAETWEREARVPILENLHELQQALRDADEGTGDPQQNVQSRLREGFDRSRELGRMGAGGPRGSGYLVCGLPEGGLEAQRVAEDGSEADMQFGLQRRAARGGLEGARQQGASELAAEFGGGVDRPHDRRQQSGMEGRADLSQPEGCVCQPVDQVRALPDTVLNDGTAGWVRDGAPTSRGRGDRPGAATGRSRSPHQPRRDGQCGGEPDALRDQRRAQGVRAWRGHRSAVVRVVPFHYVGKVWCLRVPTGAFVAVRNGVAFPTGNSGFPKSHDVSKAIDKVAGAEREVTGRSKWDARKPNGSASKHSVGLNAEPGGGDVTLPATAEAKQWQGWGTALKPAWEPICLARKPLREKSVHVVRNVEAALREQGFEGEIRWTSEPASDAAKRAPSPISSLTDPPSAAGTSVDLAGAFATAKHAPPIENDSAKPIVDGLPQTQIEPESIVAEPTGDCGTKLSQLTDQTADAVEKQSESSSLSTISTGEEQNTESLSAKSMSNCDAKASQAATESFVGIATGLTGSMERVLIKRTADGSFVWPEKLPEYVEGKSLTVAANVLAHGVGALNIDGCRVPTDETIKATRNIALGSSASGVYGTATVPGVYEQKDAGRWPANVVHDGSDEVLACFPDAPGQQADISRNAPSPKTSNVYGKMSRAGEASADRRYTEAGSTDFAALPGMRRNDSGSAARFFYTAKADADDRLGSKHPTVKPVDLMRWLIRLVTPPGGTVLDPFAGTGTTGAAAFHEGCHAILIEREAEYLADIERRMSLIMASARERKHESTKARSKAANDHGPLFGVNPPLIP